MTHTVADALRMVVENAGRQEIVASPLDDALGLVLAEAVASDLDSPPFDKALMDGYAVRAADYPDPSTPVQLRLLGELHAGSVADQPVGAGTCWRIMTGAPIPAGADSVVMVERSQINPDGSILLDDRNFRAQQNVLHRGAEMTQGQIVLQAPALLGPVEMGLLAAVGKTHPMVFRRPRVAVLSTGDEIVPPEQFPGAGQIRNSNGNTLLALARRAGADVISLGIARDQPEDLTAKVVAGLGHDVLLLSGGVSAGVRDLVPPVLREQGVTEVFHQVALKPGKPVWFGKHAGGLVFGLPGNPVSVLVCFELFVRTALRARQGRCDVLPPEFPARLQCDFLYPTKRLTYHPALWHWQGNECVVAPTPWIGSPDLFALTQANGLLVCPISDQPHRAGDRMQVLPLLRE